MDKWAYLEELTGNEVRNERRVQRVRDALRSSYGGGRTEHLLLHSTDASALRNVLEDGCLKSKLELLLESHGSASFDRSGGLSVAFERNTARKITGYSVPKQRAGEDVKQGGTFVFNLEDIVTEDYGYGAIDTNGHTEIGVFHEDYKDAEQIGLLAKKVSKIAQEAVRAAPLVEDARRHLRGNHLSRAQTERRIDAVQTKIRRNTNALREGYNAFVEKAKRQFGAFAREWQRGADDVFIQMFRLANLPGRDWHNLHTHDLVIPGWDYQDVAEDSLAQRLDDIYDRRSIIPETSSVDTYIDAVNQAHDEIFRDALQRYRDVGVRIPVDEGILFVHEENKWEVSRIDMDTEPVATVYVPELNSEILDYTATIMKDAGHSCEPSRENPPGFVEDEVSQRIRQWNNR